MNRDEQIAEKHLRFRGYQDVHHHPDGEHRPPDFLVDGAIAVEVRRLNQNERGRDTPVGLEVKAIPFTGRLMKLLATYGDAGSVKWYVMLGLRRPLPTWDRAEGRIKQFLQAVLNDPPAQGRLDVDFDGRVELE
jgi:hypothetical protein